MARALAICVGALFCALSFLAFGLSLRTIQTVALVALLTYVSLRDFAERIIPNGCVAGLIAIRLAYLILLVVVGDAIWIDLVFYAASGVGVWALMQGLVLLLERIVGAGGMGGGDIKLYAVSGFCVGFETAIAVIVASSALGAIAGALGAGVRGRNATHADGKSVLKATFPLGPAIAFCLSIALLIM